MYQWMIQGNREQKKKAHQYFRNKNLEGRIDPSTGTYYEMYKKGTGLFGGGLKRRFKTHTARTAYSRIVSGGTSPLNSYKDALKRGNKKEIEFKLNTLNKHIKDFNDDHGFEITLSQVLND